jgi:signal transduction histidine kinase
MMPGMSGDELVRAARRSEALRDIPIVLLTARSDDALRLQMLEEGALEYLTKPFSAPELRARVANLVALQRARRMLQDEVQSRERDLGALAAELIERQRELVRAVRAAQVERDRAERASRAKSDFLALVSHELLTPVTAALLACDRLERDRAAPLAPRQAAMLSGMGGELAQLASTIRLLVEHSRIDTVGLAVRREPVDVADLATQVVEEVRPLAQRKGLAVALALESPPPLLHTDAQLLRTVLANLASNAVKFTEAGSVTVKVGRDDGACTVAVEDTGPGIPERERARIFEPFETLEPLAHKHVPGVGLGLALARRLAAALGGRLEVESADGGGSRFLLTLPEVPGASDPAALPH